MGSVGQCSRGGHLLWSTGKGNKMQTDPAQTLAYASLMNPFKSLSMSSTDQDSTQMDSLTSNMTDMTMDDSAAQTDDVFLASMASHSLPLPPVDQTQQTLQNLQMQQQQLLTQQQQLQNQLKRMEIEENNLWDKSEQYQKQFAQYQQLLGHQQAQLEMQLHQLAFHHKHCQKEILPGSCWM